MKILVAEQTTLEEAMSVAEIARWNLSDMFPDTTLPTWVVVKLLDELEDRIYEEMNG